MGERSAPAFTLTLTTGYNADSVTDAVGAGDGQLQCDVWTGCST